MCFFPNHVHKQFNQKSGRFQFYFVSGLPFVAASASRNKQDMPMMTNKHTCLYNLTGSTICGFTVKQNFYRGKKVARARVRKMIDQHVRDFWNWWYHNVFAKEKPVPRPTSVKPMLHGLKSYQYSTIGVFGDMVQQSPYGIQTGWSHHDFWKYKGTFQTSCKITKPSFGQIFWPLTHQSASGGTFFSSKKWPQFFSSQHYNPASLLVHNSPQIGRCSN